MLATAASLEGDALATQLRLFTLISLWGNRMDLSLWPAGSAGNVADAFAEVCLGANTHFFSHTFVCAVHIFEARCAFRIVRCVV